MSVYQYQLMTAEQLVSEHIRQLEIEADEHDKEATRLEGIAAKARVRAAECRAHVRSLRGGASGA